MQIRRKTVQGSWTRIAETTFGIFSSCPWQDIVCGISCPQRTSVVVVVVVVVEFIQAAGHLLPTAVTVDTQSIAVPAVCELSAW